jgi:hypothetical protein
MQENMHYNITHNQEMSFHLYDDISCRNFIQANFPEEVLRVFDTLIPGAYKADLWRYCILYKKGGVYLDIKYKCIHDFRLVDLTYEETFVRDIPPHCIYNACMSCLPGNQYMKKCIEKIVEHVNTRFYGTDPLHVTGPRLLGSFFTEEDVANMHFHFKKIYNTIPNNPYVREIICKGTEPILEVYEKYRMEQFIHQKAEYYYLLWANKRIYKEEST